MKYDNRDKDLRVKMFYSGWSDPKDLESAVSDFLEENPINIIEITEIANKSARWLTIYYTETKPGLDGVL
jgi:hypothetical protein